MRNGVGAVLEKARDGERISDAEALTLLESKDLVAIGKTAESLRARRTDPGRITFIIDRNVNYTNVCVTDCDFCAFYRRPGDRAEGYLLPKTVIFKKIEETLAIGGTGVLMQGGHHPDLAVDYYARSSASPQPSPVSATPASTRSPAAGRRSSSTASATSSPRRRRVPPTG